MIWIGWAAALIYLIGLPVSSAVFVRKGYVFDDLSKAGAGVFALIWPAIGAASLLGFLGFGTCWLLGRAGERVVQALGKARR